MRGVLVLVLCVLAVSAQTTSNNNNATTPMNFQLEANDTVLLLVDYQPFMFSTIRSHDPTLVQNNVIALAKTAKLFNIPVVLTTLQQNRFGPFIKVVSDIFPNSSPIDRSFINPFDDTSITDKIHSSGKTQLLIAGLPTDFLSLPVISGVLNNYQVFVVTDCCGATSEEAHDVALARMAQFGSVPLTWFSTLGTLQKDFSNNANGMFNLWELYGGNAGVSYLWEQQCKSNQGGQSGQTGQSQTGQSTGQVTGQVTGQQGGTGSTTGSLISGGVITGSGIITGVNATAP